MPLRCAFERGRSLPWKSQGTLCFLVGCDLDRSATLVNARPCVGPSPRPAPSALWTELWARCEEIVQFRRNYTQEFQFLRQFCIVAPFNSREHLLARESAGYRRCGPLPRASVRRRSSLEGRELSGSWSARDAAVFEEASVSSGLVRLAFGPAAARCSGPRAGDRPGSGRFLRELPKDRVARQPGSGGGQPLRGLPVRHREPGCPADPGFRREGAGRTSAYTFPAKAASLPRVGELADPGPRRFRKDTA